MRNQKQHVFQKDENLSVYKALEWLTSSDDAAENEMRNLLRECYFKEISSISKDN